MKHTLQGSAPRAAWCALSFALALAACGPTAPEVTETVAEVEPVRAGVTVTEPGASGRADDVRRLRAGAVVETDGSGRALLALDHGERVLLDRDTRVEVNAAGALTLARGRVWLAGATATDALRRDAATLTAGAATLQLRGARASVRRQGDGAEVDVLGGEVAFTAGAHRGAARAGERAVLTASAATVTPRPLFDDWTGGFADEAPAGVSAGGAVGLGSVAARLPSEAGAPRWPLVLQRVDAHVSVLGDLAVTELDQTFFNPSADAVEGLYELRVPRGAVLQRFAVDRRGVLVDGVVHERQSAAAQYQSQVYAGSPFDPALLEWDAPGRYHARFFPIQPGSVRRVVVSFTQWLRPSPDGTRSYRLPLSSLGARVGELRVDVDLSRVRPRGVRATNGTTRDEQHLSYTLNDAVPTSDFVVDLRGEAPSDGTLLRVSDPRESRGAADPTGYVRVAVRAPVEDARSPRDRGVDLVIVVDHSAATDARALQLQQAVVEALVGSLGEGDRVLLVAGDVGARPVGAAGLTLTPVTPDSRRAALEALASDRRGGATDLGAMLDAAQGALDPRRNGSVVYVGDGQATVGESELATLRARVDRMSPRPRLYAVAVGESPRLDLLSGLTEPSGFSTRVARRGEVAPAVMELIAHAARPLVRGLSADLGPGVDRVYPSGPVDLPAGDALVLIGRSVGAPPREATVRATWNGAETRRRVHLTALAMPDRGDLRYRWASARLDHLLARGESRTVIVELGSRYGLITPFTSLFVAGEPPTYAAPPRVSDARSFSVFDLLPLVGCMRGAEPASASESAPAPPTSQVAASAPTTPAGNAARSEEGRMGGRYARNREAQEGERAGDNDTTATDEPSQPPAVTAELPSTGGEETAPAPNAEPAAAPAEPEAAAAATGVFAALGAAQQVAPGGGGGEMRARATARHAARPRAVEQGLIDALDGTVARGPAARESGRRLRDGDRLARLGTEDRAQNDRGEGRRDGDLGGDGAQAQARGLSRCSDAASVTLAEREGLWRERLRHSRGASGAAAVWSQARRACELPGWADRAALLRAMLASVSDVDGQVALYRAISDAGAKGWIRDAILRRLARSGELARVTELGLDRLDPSFLAQALSRATTPAERLAVLRPLARRHPEDLDLWLLLLDAAATVGDRDEVRRAAERLRDDPRSDARVRTAVGEALLAIGDASDARRAFSEIVEFAPDDPAARRRLGEIALAHGWADEAYRQFQTLAAALDDAPEILLRLAWAARLAGRLDESLRLAERVATDGASGSDPALAESAAAWISAELALAAASDDTPREVVSALRERWRRSPAARGAGAVRAVLRWRHPDDGAELWLTIPGAPSRRADVVASRAPMESTVFAESPESLSVEVRRSGGARPRGEAELIVIWDEGTARERVAREEISLDSDHPRFTFTASDGALRRAQGEAAR
ncbi:MAG: VIT domain-containing protein [Polyangiales bacterium]